ncbi:MAG TPA: 2-oxoglutarate dehydrogenase E1 component [Pirellulales bacterium]|jgi:2-oxoglutarate dehydrogenase E1 component|nr:2-oxoglutarate dehydrogenase E1 component [Pirellulales bacterium]
MSSVEDDQLDNLISLPFIEGLFDEYQRDPDSVPEDWRSYFENLEHAQPEQAPEPQDREPQDREPQDNGHLSGNGHAQRSENGAGHHPGNGHAASRLGPSFATWSIFNPPTPIAVSPAPRVAHLEQTASPSMSMAMLQDRVDQIVRAFRVRGHMMAQLDPLGTPRPPIAELDPSRYGFSEADLDRTFSTDTIEGAETLTLRAIIERMRNTYCREIGVQFMHMDDLAVRQWLQDRMERTENRLQLKRQEQLRILVRLTDAVIFEEFLQKKFLGSKSFSLEGAESLIPLLEMSIEKAGEQGIEEIVLAMAHRGRLNVLANIMGKSPQEIFREFADLDPELHLGRGDVKYHLGYSSDWITTAGRKIHLSLCFNPSHLEYVNPVALGRLRAKQDRHEDYKRKRGLSLLIHGDAAFAGEGIVPETMNLSELEGYRTGGTVHIVVNNQVGFTTSPRDARSTRYATDVAKMLQIPIFHVNGENPEAVAQVVRLAMEFRDTFQRDVVIDMYCYRRRGHNEGDEPSFTQPKMYRVIERHKSVRDAYLENLLKAGGITQEEADKIATRQREKLEQELSVAKSDKYQPHNETPARFWSGWQGGPESDIEEVQFRVSKSRLSELLEIQTKLPEGFTPHPKIERLLEQRREMAAGKRGIDWAVGESLAFATLLTEGLRIRLTGQDCQRGTFSHRHAVLHDYQNDSEYMPLAHLEPSQGPIEIFNSPLSESAVLGFEYGYSLDTPEGLVIWEAQFGDFCNVAQVVIDQFIASGEDKWRRLSGITLLLPHGFEGMGPEHSSARLERFLSLSASDNIQIVNLTTPAQYFHCLRRQVLRSWRKPLVIMSPKSLLRHPKAVSTLEECANGRFQRVIPDVEPKRAEVDRVLICCGKIYYELEQQREELERDDVAIIRLEQLYPMPKESLRAALAPYPDGTPVFWVQEEPENMGAWRNLRYNLGDRLFDRLPFSGIFRRAAASPATGSGSSHKLEQRQLLIKAFGGV